jgi:hypothetical protein
LRGFLGENVRKGIIPLLLKEIQSMGELEPQGPCSSLVPKGSVILQTSKTAVLEVDLVKPGCETFEGGRYQQEIREGESEQKENAICEPQLQTSW